MPRLSRIIIRTALCYLTAGFAAGAVLLINKAAPLHPGAGYLTPIHYEWVLVGWMVQFAMGVAYWILPRFGGARPRSVLVYLAFGLLNAGLLMSAAAVIIGGPAGLVTTGRLLQLAAIGAFVPHIAPRIKPPAGHVH